MVAINTFESQVCSLKFIILCLLKWNIIIIGDWSEVAIV